MTCNSKVIWSEGMLLRPQHLQQQDRYLRAQLEARVAPLRSFGWGFSALRIDTALLAQGKLGMLEARGIFPDGTPFDIGGQDDTPAPLELPHDTRDLLVVLALPLRRPGVPEVTPDGAEDCAARDDSAEIEVHDYTGRHSSALVKVGKLRLTLVPEADALHGYTALGVVRVLERRADGTLLLDQEYCAPCLDIAAAPPLQAMVRELVGLLRQRGAALAARLGDPEGGVAAIVDFLMLQLLNRHQPRYEHLATLASLHPLALYESMLALAGELATFRPLDRRPAQYPPYRHDRLAESYAPVLFDIRSALSVVMGARAVQVALEERQYGLRVGMLADRTLLEQATFVLAANAEIPPENLRRSLPAQVKVGAVAQIGDLVNLQLPGIALHPLPVAPRQMPFLAGFTYFELDRDSAYWRQLADSPAIALHVAGTFPGLQLQLWALRHE